MGTVGLHTTKPCRLRPWLLLLAITGTLFHASAGELPADAFSGLPDMSSVRISPDGARVFMLRRVGDAMQPFVGDLRSGDGTQPISIKHGRQLLRGCEWASNERLICSFLKFYKLKAGPPKGGYTARGDRMVRLVAVDHDGGNPLELVPKLRKPQKLLASTGWMRMSRVRPDSETSHRVVSLLPRDPRNVLVSTPRDYLFGWSVYRLDIYDNRMSAAVAEISPKSMNALQWSADGHGVVRVGVGVSLRPRGGSWGRREVAVSDGAGGFRVADIPRLGDGWLPPRVLGFSADGERVYIESSIDGSQRLEIHEADSATLELRRRIAADPGRDLSAEAVRGTECGVVGFDHAATNRFTWLDEAFALDVEALDAKLPGSVHAVPSMTADCSTFVALLDGGGLAPTWYLHDRKTGTTRRLGSERPALDGLLADTRSWQYRTRDGYPISSFLTLPDEADGGPLPLVVLTSGGRLGQTEGYDAWAEFLASRGYAVLRPAPRGTAGYGSEHWKAGFAMWGAKLRDDIHDGVAALAADGTIDPQRVCYAGRAYGGYMAMAAAAGESSAARCAASFAFKGEEDSDRARDPRTGYHQWHWTSWLGKPAYWVEEDALAVSNEVQGEAPTVAPTLQSTARSPLLNANHPGVPLLIAGPGSKGRPLEHREHSRSYEEALSEAGKLERMWYRGSERELEFLQELERFLDAEIGSKE